MKQIKLYTLKEDVVTVTNDYINLYNYQEQPIRIRGSDEFVVSTPNQVTQVAVERYVEFGKNKKEEHLVAFDPEIRKLLGINEQKLKDELVQMKRLHDGAIKTNETLVKYKNDLLKENEDLVEKLNAYSFITFWQRLLFLFTGKVGDTK